jgi:hypothetical protein
LLLRRFHDFLTGFTQSDFMIVVRAQSHMGLRRICAPVSCQEGGADKFLHHASEKLAMMPWASKLHYMAPCMIPEDGRCC